VFCSIPGLFVYLRMQMLTSKQQSNNKALNNTNCGSAFEPGASGLPYYCASICVPSYVRSWCNWRASSMDSKLKKKLKRTTHRTDWTELNNTPCVFSCITGGASDIVKAKSSGDGSRATKGLVSNLPHPGPRVNKTKQHTALSSVRPPEFKHKKHWWAITRSCVTLWS